MNLEEREEEENTIDEAVVKTELNVVSKSRQLN